MYLLNQHSRYVIGLIAGLYTNAFIGELVNDNTFISLLMNPCAELCNSQEFIRERYDLLTCFTWIISNTDINSLRLILFNLDVIQQENFFKVIRLGVNLFSPPMLSLYLRLRMTTLCLHGDYHDHGSLTNLIRNRDTTNQDDPKIPQDSVGQFVIPYPFMSTPHSLLWNYSQSESDEKYEKVKEYMCFSNVQLVKIRSGSYMKYINAQQNQGSLVPSSVKTGGSAFSAFLENGDTAQEIILPSDENNSAIRLWQSSDLSSNLYVHYDPFFFLALDIFTLASASFLLALREAFIVHTHPSMMRRGVFNSYFGDILKTERKNVTKLIITVNSVGFLGEQTALQDCYLMIRSGIDELLDLVKKRGRSEEIGVENAGLIDGWERWVVPVLENKEDT
jgi:hypothetical protein